MFGRGRIKAGDYVFVVHKDQNYNKLVIGRVQSANGKKFKSEALTSALLV